MNRLTVAAALACLALASPALAIPNAITYQGSLKEKGLPVTGTRTLLFRLTNSDGTQVYWSSGNVPVNVTNGLFSTKLTPSGVNWTEITPFVEVSIQGQLLSPREAVGSSPYALVCGTSADEVGMVAMFTGDCPAGWARFTALDNNFPMGGAAYGATGGSATSGSATGVVFANGQGANSFIANWRTGNAGNAPISQLPPYLTMVFCQKQ